MQVDLRLLSAEVILVMLAPDVDVHADGIQGQVQGLPHFLGVEYQPEGLRARLREVCTVGPTVHPTLIRAHRAGHGRAHWMP